MVGFLKHGFTNTMISHLSEIKNKDKYCVKKLSKLLDIRRDSLLDTIRKKRYNKFIKIEGEGNNKIPFIIPITQEGPYF